MGHHRSAATIVVAIGVLFGCSGAQAPGEAQRIVAPNEVIADLVRRVACAGEELDVVVGPPDAADPVPAVRFGMGPDSGDQSDAASTLVLLVTDLVPTIEDNDGEADPMFWLDPARASELTAAIGGALVVGADLDGDFVDRCIARVRAELALLDQDIAEQLDALEGAERAIDVTVPGAVYFATRYDLASSLSLEAQAASEALSTGDLGDAVSYDDMMRANVGKAIAILQNG